MMTSISEYLSLIPFESFGEETLFLLAIASAAAVLGLILVIGLRVKKKIKLLWGFAAVLLALAAFGACIVGATVGTVITVADGSPRQTVDNFFLGIVNGNYQSSYKYLDDYVSLGLGEEAGDPASQKLLDALTASYAYELAGECEVKGLSAVQPVRFTYFDLTKIADELEAESNAYLEKIVDERYRSQIYDSEDHYLPSVTDEVYDHAVDCVVSHAEDYYNTVLLNVELSYSDGEWSLHTSGPMLNALVGGTAY